VDLSDLDPDPLLELAAWLDAARLAGIANADAMALATSAPDGSPSVRMVLARGCDDRGLAFYTNLESRKADELATRPRAAGVFYWQPLERQARVEGAIEHLEDAEAQAYFDTRPRGSRLAAWASPQSRPLELEELERRYAEMEARFAGVDDLPLPPHWGGYRLRPDVVELWHGRPDRLHDRIRYERDGGSWRRFRLAP
jgi:pyridoxamine 5'-phosphate oxidase